MLFDRLYRIFYVVFAMELVAVVLLPVLLVCRFLMRNIPSKYKAWAWRLYFLRILCPAAISSTYSIVPAWNRAYHRILASLGVTMQKNPGLLISWRTVFETEIETGMAYRVCVFVWLAGIILLFGITVFRQHKIRKSIRQNAVHLEGRIYQAAVPSPVMIGLFRCRYYLPEQTEVKQLRHLLAHLEAQRSRKSQWWCLAGFGIALLHWFDPLVWYAYTLARKDEEMACDDLTVKHLGTGETLLYAQSLLNMAKEAAVIPYTVSVIFEQDLKKRSVRMLYHRPYIRRQHLCGGLLLILLAFWIFGLRPFQMAWAGGTWNRESTAEPVSSKTPDELENIVGQCVTTSPNGLELTLRLVMTEGTRADGIYRGQFALELISSVGETYQKRSFSEMWDEQLAASEQFVFPQNLTMQTGDYNGDGMQEILLGQQIDWDKEQEKKVQDAVFQEEGTAGEIEYIYQMISVGERDLTVVSDPIYALGDDDQQAAVPVVQEGIKDLFAVWVLQGKNYYVWDTEEQRYHLEKMTQEQLNQHKAASEGTTEAGQKETKTLQDSAGTVQMTVETQSDTTGSLAIRSVLVGPEGKQKQMDKVDGYYCELVWATEQDETSDRYAVLIYNGTKAQTFLIYDVQSKQVYYQQEDGNAMLAEVFQQYNGATISFEEGGVVVYSLLSIEDDVLQISFAANADDGVTVRGSYQYHMEDGRMSDLSFSQSTEQTDNESTDGESADSEQGGAYEES